MKSPVLASALAAFVGLTGIGAPAGASLTASELNVVRTFVQKASLDTAPRVRALVARPDLTKDEVSAALRSGYAAVPFDDQHRRFTEALLFGPGSSASRNTLVPAVVEGLLARAAARMDAVPVDWSARVDAKAGAAAEEVIGIHAFIDAKIANAGRPGPDGHDPSTGIRDDAIETATLLYKAHLGAHERWLHPAGRGAPELVRLRVQAELALIDLARGVVGRHQVSEWLALDGERKAVFERSGVLVDTDGPAPEPVLALAVQWLESTQATEGLSAWLLSKANPAGIAARGRVVRAGVVLSPGLHPLPADALWPEDVKPSSPDASQAAIARSVAELATTRTLVALPLLRQRARDAAEHAARALAPGYLSPSATRQALGTEPSQSLPPELVLAGAVQLLLLDAPRAVELAIVRAGEGRPEPLEQLSLALSIASAGRDRATLGRTRSDGSIEPLEASEVKGDGVLVNAFVLAGKHYALVPDRSGTLTAAVDGARPKLTSLASFSERTQPGTSWTVNGTEYARLYGEPTAAVLDDGRFVVDGSRGGFDALAAGETADDVEVSATLKPTGKGGGLLVRGTAGESSYEGIGLMLEPADSRARLLTFDGKGKAVQLAEPLPLPASADGTYAVSLKVDDDHVTARVANKTLTGKLGREVPPGKPGIVVHAQGRVDVQKFKIVPKTLAKVQPGKAHK